MLSQDNAIILGNNFDIDTICMDYELQRHLDKALIDFTCIPEDASSNIWDGFFDIYGPGNSISEINRPTERHSIYKILLASLFKNNPKKYQNIHKGNAFFFLSWTAWDTGNVSESLYYLDCAISEDIRNDGHRFKENPAYKTLLLDDRCENTNKIMISKIKKVLSSTYQVFCNDFTSTKDLDTFIQEFLDKVLLNPKEYRSIIISFYTFVLEYNRLSIIFDISPKEPRATDLFIINLIRGTNLFESILKLFYPTLSSNTLGGIFKDANFKTDFPVLFPTKLKKIDPIVLVNKSIPDIISFINNPPMKHKNAAYTMMWAAYGIRNQVSHNIVQSINVDEYCLLVNTLFKAIYYLITVKV